MRLRVLLFLISVVFVIYLLLDKTQILFPLGRKSLRDVVESSLVGAKGVYSVIIKNLKTNESYTLNDNRVFEAGSLYKLWIMATVFEQIEKGLLNKDEVLTRQIQDLNKKFNIDEDLAELKVGVITLSVSKAIEQMITISHNYAGLLLAERIKLSSVAAFLEQNGFSESKVGRDGSSPKTTAQDTALFFEKLYQGNLASEASTEKMLSVLKKQKLINKLPKYLPKETFIAHKTSEIGWFSHDAGIVFLGKGDYIIVVLSESNLPQGANERIASISKAVYEYFENNENKKK